MNEPRGNGNANNGGGMGWFFGQMLFLPIRTVFFGFEILLEGMRGLTRGINNSLPFASPQQAEPPANWGAPQAQTLSSTVNQRNEIEEKKQMDNTDLNDDLLKLVRYKILYVKRGHEAVLKDENELVFDNMDGAAFIAWKIAEYLTEPGHKEISHNDQKYLRVYFDVLERSPRQRLHYEEDQLDRLEEIRDAIRGLGGAPASSSGTGSGLINAH